MFFEFIEHKHITKEYLAKIIEIKNSVWEYPIESHLAWINDNIQPDDVHLILSERNEIIGYLNLTNVIINGFQAWGIGNVCVRPSKQGQKFGALLMKLTEYHMIRTNIPGILICKDRVKNFYTACGLLLYPGSGIDPNGNKIPHNIMVRNLDSSLFQSQAQLKFNRLF